MEIKNINDLWGNNQAKRAIEIALAGRLSVKLIGGKEAFAVGDFLKKQGLKVYVFYPCFCGNYGDRQKECVCDVLELKRYLSKIEKIETDMTIKIERVLGKDIMVNEEEFEKEAVDLLRNAVEKLGLGQVEVLSTIKIAKTIASMDKSLKIKVYHIAEALQYRFSL